MVATNQFHDQLARSVLRPAFTLCHTDEVIEPWHITGLYLIPVNIPTPRVSARMLSKGETGRRAVRAANVFTRSSCFLIRSLPASIFPIKILKTRVPCISCSSKDVERTIAFLDSRPADRTRIIPTGYEHREYKNKTFR